MHICVLAKRKKSISKCVSRDYANLRLYELRSFATMLFVCIKSQLHSVKVELVSPVLQKLRFNRDIPLQLQVVIMLVTETSPKPESEMSKFVETPIFSLIALADVMHPWLGSERSNCTMLLNQLWCVVACYDAWQNCNFQIFNWTHFVYNQQTESANKSIIHSPKFSVREPL